MGLAHVWICILPAARIADLGDGGLVPGQRGQVLKRSRADMLEQLGLVAVAEHEEALESPGVEHRPRQPHDDLHERRRCPAPKRQKRT